MTSDEGDQQSQRSFDLLVVGSGEAGTNAALACRERGWSVAVVDERPFGGTCALRGCDPKKVLVAAARVIDSAQRLVDIGVIDRAPRLQWQELMRFKRSFTEPVARNRVRMFEEAGIVALRGHARFEDEQTLRVGDEHIRANHVLIATGAREQHVAPGDDQLLTSEAFLDLETLPTSLIFVGGGYISFEFAHVAARAGVEVTILHNDARPLRGFDPDIVDRLLDVTREMGIQVYVDTPVTAVERKQGTIVVHVGQGDSAKLFRAQGGILGAGRVPNLDDLGLEIGRVGRGKRGITVNEYLQSTTNPRVYAAGDAADAGGLPLTPVAAHEGEVVASNLLDGNTHTMNFRSLATIVYTIPPLGALGMSEATVRERGADYEVRAGDMSAWYSTRHVAARAAFYKVILERGTGEVLGATILGPHAEEQINVLALAVQNGYDGEQIARTLFAYPTGSSDLEYLVS
jgi:glutathione reductase (NADPH)